MVLPGVVLPGVVLGEVGEAVRVPPLVEAWDQVGQVAVVEVAVVEVAVVEVAPHS